MSVLPWYAPSFGGIKWPDTQLGQTGTAPLKPRELHWFMPATDLDCNAAVSVWVFLLPSKNLPSTRSQLMHFSLMRLIPAL